MRSRLGCGPVGGWQRGCALAADRAQRHSASSEHRRRPSCSHVVRWPRPHLRTIAVDGDQSRDLPGRCDRFATDAIARPERTTRSAGRRLVRDHNVGNRGHRIAGGRFAAQAAVALVLADPPRRGVEQALAEVRPRRGRARLRHERDRAAGITAAIALTSRAARGCDPKGDVGDSWLGPTECKYVTWAECELNAQRFARSSRSPSSGTRYIHRHARQPCARYRGTPPSLTALRASV